ncbi:MAG: adenosine deaminase [Caldilineaceae bacterium]|nr:adenosine deaminase [Caldilineaceae bacterium]
MSAHLIQSMPKAELHIHLEGSIDVGTLLELADRHDALDQLPAQDEEGLRRWFLFRNFPHFVEIYMTIQALLRTADDFSTIVYRCGEDMAAQCIRYRELTVTTYTHTHLQSKGLHIEGILEGLEDGRRRARRDFGVEMRWIFDVPRNASFRSGSYDPSPADVTLAHALLGRDQGVVGFGLGGYEVGAPPQPFAHAFHAARDAGLYSVPHAGETVGPESIWGAVTDLCADRIGHGVRAIEDPTLLLLLAERQIPLELNPISNVRLGIYPSPEFHPFPHLDGMGLLVTVNSDDPPLFNTSLVDEYRLLAEIFGYGEDDLIRIARNAFRVSAAEPTLKQSLLAEFDEWAAL